PPLFLGSPHALHRQSVSLMASNGDRSARSRFLGSALVVLALCAIAAMAVRSGDWLFDLDDEAQVAAVVPAVLSLATDPEAAKAAKARKFVEKRQRETTALLKRRLVG
ncbi:MAG: hypothetical protein AAF961_12345, partial [Planctomycetota bacterium]